MKVNISFLFDSETEQVSELKVSQIAYETPNARIVDMGKEIVLIDNNTVRLTETVLTHLGLRSNDRIGLLVEGSEEFELYLVNPRLHSVKDEMTYRITNKYTINVRGGNRALLHQMGPDFSCGLAEEGKIKLNKQSNF